MTMFKATRIIDEAFNEKDIRHNIEQHGESESVCAGFAVKKGPLVMVRFISQDDDNDVAVRILSLFNDIPEDEWPRILKVINKVNCEKRYAKFCLDDDGDIHVEIDVPVRCSDDCLGKVACELFYRTMQIVQEKYEEIARALYMEDAEEDDEDMSGMGSFEDFLRRYQMEPDDAREETDHAEPDDDVSEADIEEIFAETDDDATDSGGECDAG